MPISCEPSDLAAAAKCFACLTPDQLQAMQTYLLAQLANHYKGTTTDPQALVQLSAAFNRYIPPGMHKAVQNYLLCQIANL